MQKVLSIFIVTVLLIALLAGCNSNNTSSSTDGTAPDNGTSQQLVGTDAAKLLLANQRLQSQLLDNEDDIFETGVEVFANLATIAVQNLANYTTGDSAVPLSTEISSADGSTLTIDGDLYQWGNLAEYSNYYDYFINLTNAIVSGAESAAELINQVKTYVRVIDKWVDVEGTQYYLSVGDNWEILFSRWGDSISICKRSKNEYGVNVYELYQSESGNEKRMTYIPGQLYEYNYHSASYDFCHNFIAENTKGYWEIMDVSCPPDNIADITCMVMKDDICYAAVYSPNEENQGILALKVISSDRSTDLVEYTGGTDGNTTIIELALQSFDGIAYLQMETDKIGDVSNIDIDQYDLLRADENGKIYYNTTGVKSAEVVLDNGMILKDEDTYYDGNVTVGRTLISYFNKMETSGYSASLTLRITGESYMERMELLQDFLEMTGLTCKRDFNYVVAGITRAFQEVEQFIKYARWHESPIATVADIQQGYANLEAEYRSWQEAYEAVENEEVIDFSDEAAMELNIHFSPVTESSAGNVTCDGLAVSVADICITAEDTALFVEGETYVVNFALCSGEDQGLVHISAQGTQSATYNGEKTFAVPQSADFTLPVLAPGEYTLVAYISTADDIRMTEYTPICFTDILEYETKEENIAVNIRSNGEMLKVTYSYISEIEVAVAFDAESVTYSMMYEKLAQCAYEYGFAESGSMVELLGVDQQWAALTGEEETLATGTYRLKYSIQNGEYWYEGYVYTQYTASASQETVE